MKLQGIQLKIDFGCAGFFDFRFFRAMSSGVAFVLILEKYRWSEIMKKIVLTEDQVDKLVVVDRVTVKPTVYGVGCVDVPFKTYNNGKHFWQYQLWSGLLRRCFNESFKKAHPTYKDVTCCDEWLSFANFLAWCNKEVGYKGKLVGSALDKDLIVKGNRVYSPTTCSFVPRAVNNLLTSSGSVRGKYPVGVCFDTNNGAFKVQVNHCGVLQYLGLYGTPEEAFAVYKIAKEAQIKAVANQYRGVIKPAVFDLLMGWEVD